MNNEKKIVYFYNKLVKDGFIKGKDNISIIRMANIVYSYAPKFNKEDRNFECMYCGQYVQSGAGRVRALIELKNIVHKEDCIFGYVYKLLIEELNRR